MKDGIYHLSVRGSDEWAGVRAIVLVRDGRFFGSDGPGAVFRGICANLPGSGCETITGTLSVPPDAELVTGFSAGPGGSRIEIAATIDPPSPKSVALATVGGAEIEVEIRYIGGLHGKSGRGRERTAGRYGSIGREENAPRLAG